MPGRVVHCKKEPYDVYIGRPSKWGNPFSHLEGKGDIKVDTREEAIAGYELYLQERPELVAAARRELRGKVLGCWCSPKSCHGDILVRIANEPCEFCGGSGYLHGGDICDACEPWVPKET